MTQPAPLLALFVAAHAVAETRLGPPYDFIRIVDGAEWTAPERPLTWRSEQEASELLVRLAVGYAAVNRSTDADEPTAMRIAEDDLLGIASVLAGLNGAALSPEESAARAMEAAEAFLNDDANARAIALVEQQLLTMGSLDMHEVDFLVEAADGEPEALENLERYRASFSTTQVPWPDQT
jgi:hypothetical protein